MNHKGSGLPYSTFQLELCDLPGRYPVEDGTYPGWCCQKDKEISDSDNPFDATIYDTTKKLPKSISCFEWDKINYVINDRDDLNWKPVQNAIWHFCGYDYEGTDSFILDLIDDADEYGDGYDPRSDGGNVKAYAVYVDCDTQIVFVEVPVCDAKTVRFWKNHCETWEDWEPSSGSLYEDRSQKTLKGYLKGNDELWEKVRAQLLAAELNFYYFGEGTECDYDFEACCPGIGETMEDAASFLEEYSDPGCTWSGCAPGKRDPGYKAYKSEGDEILDDLREFNGQ
jgi:hypothetical protein